MARFEPWRGEKGTVNEVQNERCRKSFTTRQSSLLSVFQEMFALPLYGSPLFPLLGCGHPSLSCFFISIFIVHPFYDLQPLLSRHFPWHIMWNHAQEVLPPPPCSTPCRGGRTPFRVPLRGCAVAAGEARSACTLRCTPASVSEHPARCPRRRSVRGCVRGCALQRCEQCRQRRQKRQRRQR